MSEQKILKECKETEKVKVGSFEFGDVVVDAELVLAYRQASALNKIDRLMRYRFDPDKKSIYVFLEKPDFIIPIDLKYWESLVEEAFKQHMKDGKTPTQPVVIRIPEKGMPAITKNGLQPAIELSFKPKPKKKGLLNRISGR